MSNSLDAGDRTKRTRNVSELEEDHVSIGSDDSIMNKLFKIRDEEKKRNKHKKDKLPFYFKESLPDPKYALAKNMAAKIPSNIMSPGVEQLQIMVSALYNVEKAKQQQKVCKQQMKKSKKRKTKNLDGVYQR